MAENKDKCCDKSRFMNKNEKLELLLDFQAWINVPVGITSLHREIYWRDIKEFLAKDCPVCRLNIHTSLESWLKCKVCK